MNDSKPSGSSTTVVNNDPWSKQSPYLTKGFQKAEEDVLNKPIQYYPNSTVVPFAPQTETALQMTENRATAGSPVLNNAQNMTAATLQGDYLNGNPNFDAAVQAATRPMVQNFQDTVMPSIKSGFEGSGRYGSGLQAYQQRKAGEGLTRQVGDVASSMAYGNYNDERGRQMQASTVAPQLAQADYVDPAQLAQVGATREGLAGAEMQDQIDRYMHEQQAPQDALTQYMALVGGGNYGGSSTQAQPIYSNKLGQALGMGATAAGIGGTLFGQNGIWPQ